MLAFPQKSLVDWWGEFKKQGSAIFLKIQTHAHMYAHTLKYLSLLAIDVFFFSLIIYNKINKDISFFIGKSKWCKKRYVK